MKLVFELKEIAATAGTTVGLVIATSIFMQLITTKSIAIFDRFHGLTAEMRQADARSKRHSALVNMIRLFEFRCYSIQRALVWLACAEFAFLATILFSCLSLMLPDVYSLKVLGALSMPVGLFCIALSVLHELRENLLAGKVVKDETSDLPDLLEK